METVFRIITMALKGDKGRTARINELVTVAFWVTNPCRITRKVKQTKDVRMYT